MTMQKPEFDTITLQTLDGVAVITLNRPERLNAISRQRMAARHRGDPGRTGDAVAQGIP